MGAADRLTLAVWPRGAMLLYLIDFGSIWSERGKFSPTGLLLPSESCVFNTTGFVKPGIKRYHLNQAVRGNVRINLKYFHRVAGPDDLRDCWVASRHIETMPGATNRLLITGPVRSADQPHAYLTAVRSGTHGSIHFEQNWSSRGVQIVCRSERNLKEQESLLLVSPDGYIFTERGGWSIQWRKMKHGISRPRLTFNPNLIPPKPVRAASACADAPDETEAGISGCSSSIADVPEIDASDSE